MADAPESSAAGQAPQPRDAAANTNAAPQESAAAEGRDLQPGQRADPYLKSMLLGLIEDSYLHTGTFTQFAAEILQVIAYAATVPVAFTEGFLRAYLSIDRIEESDEGTIKIIPKAGASEEDWIRDVNEITAQVDPSAVFNPVVRSKLTAVHEASSKVMKYDLNTLTAMDDAQLMDVLRQMQQESEELEKQEPAPPKAAPRATTSVPSSTRSARTCVPSRLSSGRTRRPTTTGWAISSTRPTPRATTRDLPEATATGPAPGLGWRSDRHGVTER